MSRVGKIARLPHEVREELNVRLERSERSPQLPAWLNALPEVNQFKPLDEKAMDADNGENSSPTPSQCVAVSRSDKIVEKAKSSVVAWIDKMGGSPHFPGMARNGNRSTRGSMNHDKQNVERLGTDPFTFTVTL